MAKRSRGGEPDESDRIEGFPHPRETLRMIGQEAALSRAARAIRSGKPPQGWLISGPPGIGKATLAYRIARYLLAYGARQTGAADLSVPANDPAAIQVAAGSHPGLMVLKRVLNERTGKLMNELPVDEVRRLAGFFGMTSAAGGWRVAIVDTADDMNANAANAVLKTLEEPPPRGVLFLVCHAPGKLLPTIRSRCRRLAFRPWQDGEVVRFLERQAGADPESALRLAAMAKGSPGRALTLMSGGGIELDRFAQELVRELPRLDEARMLALASELRGAHGAERFSLLFERLAEHVKALIEVEARRGEGRRLAPWLDAWDRLASLPAEAEALNLDRQDVLWTAALALRDAARC